MTLSLMFLIVNLFWKIEVLNVGCVSAYFLAGIKILCGYNFAAPSMIYAIALLWRIPIFLCCSIVWAMAMGDWGLGCFSVEFRHIPDKSSVVRQLVIQAVYTMFTSNNRASFHLWWKENLVKYQKVSKYYENDCSW